MGCHPRHTKRFNVLFSKMRGYASKLQFGRITLISSIEIRKIFMERYVVKDIFIRFRRNL